MAQCMHRFCGTCIEKWLRLSKCAADPITQLEGPSRALRAL